MELEELLQVLARGESLEAGTPAFECMIRYSDLARKLTAQYNCGWHELEEEHRILAELFGHSVPDDLRIWAPFSTDFGRNIRIGRRVFVNAGCCFQDQGGIIIGDDVLIGQQVVIATINHDPDPDRRLVHHIAPVVIGSRVWIGAHATICAGVTVHDGSIIAAGAVVTRDVPARTVAGGVPARVLKQIP